MITQLLNGTWELQQVGSEAVYPASVPGCVHLDLMAADVIDDPYYRDNELDVLWIGESDWIYSRTFEVDQARIAVFKYFP